MCAAPRSAETATPATLVGVARTGNLICAALRNAESATAATLGEGWHAEGNLIYAAPSRLLKVRRLPHVGAVTA